MTAKIIARRVFVDIDSVKKLELTIEYDYGLTKVIKWPVQGLTMVKIKADVKADYTSNYPDGAIADGTKPGYELDLT
jgi:hypothetical protein